MIERIIEYSLRNRALVLILAGMLALVGVNAIRTINLDAIPDLSDAQVIIATDYPGQAPQVVEDQVTYPLTTALLGIPRTKAVRGYSSFGFSMVFIIFDDGTDLYWARSRVLENLSYVSGRLPGGVSPQMGPDATGVGWVYEYTLQIDPEYAGKYDLSQLRSIQDYYLKYELSSLDGVSEVASVGGYVKQYQVVVNPDALQAFGLSISQVRDAITNSNKDVGGALIEQGEREFMVRGMGYLHGKDDILKIGIGATPDGTPIYLRQVANVEIGPELRRGITEWNGEGETVGGIIVMRSGENARTVIGSVKTKLKELSVGLPAGITIVPAYDRSELINRTVDNLKNTLIQEMAVVGLVMIVFLLHLRSSLVAFVVIPLGLLISFIVMERMGITANVMSLGGIAIAIGVMDDAAVVMVENTHEHLERHGGKMSHFDIVLNASKEVGPALFYSLIIITVSFLPVFVLGEQSGRLFKPLAYTKTFSLAAASFIGITVIPVLLYYFVKGGIIPEEKNPLSKFLHRIYHPIMVWILARKTAIAIVTGLFIIATIIPFSRLGSEFMPPLDEGDILYMPTTDPGISVTKAKELLQQTDRLIKQVPEVNTVFGKAGRADTATDMAPMSMIETVITLKPKSEWRKGMGLQDIVDELNKTVNVPGLTNAWTMPIRTRIDMLSTGIKTPVGIKVMGDDLQTLSKIAEQISSEIMKVRGTRSSYPEKAFGGNYIDIDIDRDAIARYGLTVNDVQSVITSSIGGASVASTVEGLERYPINVRYPRDYRDNLDALKSVLVQTPSGGSVPLDELANLSYAAGPPEIKTENARRTAWIYVDVRDRDVGGYVKEARALISKKIADGDIKLPAGYSIIWSGQYEYMQKAAAKLKIVIPLTLMIIIILLYMYFKSFIETLIVFFTLPFALVGGIWLLYILGYNTSVAVWVGFIALAGLAAETGIVMLVYVENAVKDAIKAGKMNTKADLDAAILEGAVLRVRPKIMSVTTTIVGLLPVMFGHETGSEVMKRIAAPMVGGLVSSTILTLFIIPAVYGLIKAHTLLPKKSKVE